MSVFQRLLYIVACSLLFLSGCRTQQVFLSPPFHEIEEIEGYASLRVSADHQSARSRFSFLFHLPEEGRLDVLDPLGRVPYQILVLEKQAFFVVPSKKVYWQAGEEEILEKFLGFPLTLPDVIALLSGHWLDSGLVESQNRQEGWILDKDRRGRIQSGRRGDFSFQVEEFFDPSPWVKTVVYFHPLSEGRLKVLDIHFNQPLKEETFSTSFLKNYTQKTWEEIQEMLFDAH